MVCSLQNFEVEKEWQINEAELKTALSILENLDPKNPLIAEEEKQIAIPSLFARFMYCQKTYHIQELIGKIEWYNIFYTLLNLDGNTATKEISKHHLTGQYSLSQVCLKGLLDAYAGYVDQGMSAYEKAAKRIGRLEAAAMLLTMFQLEIRDKKWTKAKIILRSSPIFDKQYLPSITLIYPQNHSVDPEIHQKNLVSLIELCCVLDDRFSRKTRASFFVQAQILNKKTEIYSNPETGTVKIRLPQDIVLTSRQEKKIREWCNNQLIAINRINRIKFELETERLKIQYKLSSKPGRELLKKHNLPRKLSCNALRISIPYFRMEGFLVYFMPGKSKKLYTLTDEVLRLFPNNNQFQYRINGSPIENVSIREIQGWFREEGIVDWKIVVLRENRLGEKKEEIITSPNLSISLL